MSSRMGKKK